MTTRTGVGGLVDDLAGEELATIVRDASPKVIISQDEFGEAIEQLQRALESFGGTLLLVTHDAALLDALDVDATWTFCRHGATASVHVAHR